MYTSDAQGGYSPKPPPPTEILEELIPPLEPQRKNNFAEKFQFFSLNIFFVSDCNVKIQ